mgnify:CR=1 FL=1
MLTCREIRPEDREIVIPMVEQFYTTDAVDHPVPRQIIARTFDDVANPDQPLIRGVLLYDREVLVGYFYLSYCYSCEVGGMCIFIEELFLREECRGKGYGQQAMEWLLAEYPNCRRLRLEVTQANQRAIRLYEKYGFQYLNYDQMVLDRT